MLTRRDFLKKSAILAGGIAATVAVPSVLLSNPKEEMFGIVGHLKPERDCVTTGYAQMTTSELTESELPPHNHSFIQPGDRLTIDGGPTIYTVTGTTTSNYIGGWVRA